MLTEDQVRLRIRECYVPDACGGCLAVLALLADVLPDLVTLASGRTHAEADAGRRYGADQRRAYHDLTYCPDCSRDRPCSRLVSVVGGD